MAGIDGCNAYCSKPTSLADRSQSLPAFFTSLASSDRLFSKLPVSLRQLQYLPDLLRLGSLTTCITAMITVQQLSMPDCRCASRLLHPSACNCGRC